MPIVRTVAARRLRTYFVVIRKFLRKILGLTRYHSSWVPKDSVGKVLLRLRHKSEFSDQSLRIPSYLGLLKSLVIYHLTFIIWSFGPHALRVVGFSRTCPGKAGHALEMTR